eukprot:g43738.t1
MKQSKIADKDTSLPDALNTFYGQFEQNASGTVTPAPTPALDISVPLVTAADVRLVLLGVSPKENDGPTMVGLAEHSDPDQKKLQKVVCTAQTIMDFIYTAWCCGKTANIKDPLKPSNDLLQPLPSVQDWHVLVRIKDKDGNIQESWMTKDIESDNTIKPSAPLAEGYVDILSHADIKKEEVLDVLKNIKV